MSHLGIFFLPHASQYQHLSMNINNAKERRNYCADLLNTDWSSLTFCPDTSRIECQFKCHRSSKAVSEKANYLPKTIVYLKTLFFSCMGVDDEPNTGQLPSKTILNWSRYEVNMAILIRNHRSPFKNKL